MKLRAIMRCLIAGTILATTMGIANSADLKLRIGERHAKSHAAKHRTSFHHRLASYRSHRFHGGRHHAVAGLSHKRHLSDRAPARDASGLQSGIASIYSGERTANGEYASAHRLTAAHRSLPFGTMVKVTHRSTGRSVVVRINDRGPFISGRVIDLTPAGAHALGFSGLAPVTLTVMAHG